MILRGIFVHQLLRLGDISGGSGSASLCARASLIMALAAIFEEESPPTITLDLNTSILIGIKTSFFTLFE